ncbi:hypothetical protein [Phaeacidiphilus oryzae]|jgi:hypothetical protein|uniref:hypothetical protein n=1 Tax=Phaeacidiphilus oryzae TaxID=348818 RepID=UPI00056C1240|nr:hypothetical protein [Phaeacidiphilus oryzae]
MGALAWWIIPLGAGLCAGLWATWASRARRSIGDGESVAGYQRFREAMERESAPPQDLSS